MNRFRAFVLSAFGLIAVACETAPSHQDTYSGPYTNISLSRSKGMVNKYFSARVNVHSNYVTTPEFQHTGTLPPGIGFNWQTGMFEGTPTQAGFYTIRVYVRDVNRGIDSDPNKSANMFYIQDFELQMFDKYEEPQ